MTIPNHTYPQTQIYHFIHHPHPILTPPNFPHQPPPTPITIIKINHIKFPIINLQPLSFIQDIHHPFKNPHHLI
ncbi:YmdB family metallophosphoesterase, partial [Staphylococcus epidermidis]|uniref:YmdB family metallophosphoesterase n=1 Tax=Staphylococcus epidermidis TaxID=1282 RepID=UPI0037D9BFD6